MEPDPGCRIFHQTAHDCMGDQHWHQSGRISGIRGANYGAGFAWHHGIGIMATSSISISPCRWSTSRAWLDIPARRRIRQLHHVNGYAAFAIYQRHDTGAIAACYGQITRHDRFLSGWHHAWAWLSVQICGYIQPD